MPLRGVGTSNSVSRADTANATMLRLTPGFCFSFAFCQGSKFNVLTCPASTISFQNIIFTTKKDPQGSFLVVKIIGLEPMTPCTSSRCSTS